MRFFHSQFNVLFQEGWSFWFIFISWEGTEQYAFNVCWKENRTKETWMSRLEENSKKMESAEEFQSNHVTETKWRHFRPSPATLKKLASYKSRTRAKKGWEEQNTDRRKKKNKGTEEKMRFFTSVVGPVGTLPKYMWNNPFRPQQNRTKVCQATQ